MKTGRMLGLLCILVMAGFIISGTKELSYGQYQIDKRNAPDITETTEKDKIDNLLNDKGDKTRTGKDKGSPMHAWKAIVAAGKKKGDTITTEEFAGMRNWSARTRGYELNSLVAIGVLERSSKKGEYIILVNANPDQINEINEHAKQIIGKTSKDGTKTSLGIDYFILDVKHIGGDELNEIADIVSTIVGDKEKLPGAVKSPEDFVAEDIKAGREVPASVFINDTDQQFTIGGKTLTTENYKGVTDTTNKQVLLASLVDLELVSDKAVPNEKGMYNFTLANEQKKEVVFYNGEYVLKSTPEFKGQVKKDISEGRIPAILVGNANMNEIQNVLLENFPEELRNSIKIMEQLGDVAKTAVGSLFTNMPSTPMKAADILNNDKALVKALAGSA